jgi:3',5'-cyclic-AMP phosphodiesterase
MVRFIHITDTHIGPQPHFSLYGKQPLQYLQRVVNRINDLPFDVDFVLHTGDVVDDGSGEAYALFNEAIKHLRFPIKYVVGNHDDGAKLQTTVIGSGAASERLDYTFEQDGIKFVVLDTRGPTDPAGEVRPEQLEWLRSHCTPAGPPIVIAMHHAPMKLDTPWLDAPPPGWGGRHMFITNAGELLDVLRPAGSRIRGIFTGHVHGLFITQLNGLLLCAGQSTFAPIVSFPISDRVANDTEQSVMFNLVTVTDDQTIIRPRTFKLAE